MTSRGGGPRGRGSRGGSGPSGGARRAPRGSNAGPPSVGCGFSIALLPVLIAVALFRTITSPGRTR